MKNLARFLLAFCLGWAALMSATDADAQASFLTLHTNVLSDGLFCPGVVLGPDGAVYGMTSNGGTNSVGTVFRVDPLTLNYKLLHTFTTNGNDGYSPIGAVAGGPGSGGSLLILSRDGALYGLTSLGGTKQGGTIFKVNTDGSGYQTVFNISTNPLAFVEYSLPVPCGLIQGRDGMLYVTTWDGGPDQVPDGSIFKVTTNGTGYFVLHNFDSITGEGFLPMAGLIQGRDGLLYGTTDGGGNYNGGTVFKLDTNGMNFTKIHDFYRTNFFAGSQCFYPQTPLFQASDGLLYGTTWSGGYTAMGGIYKLDTDGNNYTELHQFDDPNNYYSGGRWAGALVQDANGSLYGGIAGVSFYKIETSGSNYTEFSVPIPNYNLAAADTTYTMGPDGSLYGRFYKLRFGLDDYAVTYTFKSVGNDGGVPQAGLVQAADGALYGTTFSGGTNKAGTVFGVSPTGTTYTQLHSFQTNGVDGQEPITLLLSTDDTLYGATLIGGTNKAGTVFKLNRNGSGYGLLHTFITNGIDGRSTAALLQGRDSNLYGAAQNGGTNNVGTIFKLTVGGTGYATLHTFRTNGLDGQHVLTLAQGLDNLLYGATSGGGSNNFGTLFKLDTNGGSYTLLHTFINNAGTDGQLPEIIFQGADGRLYGVTQLGGSNNVGTVFRLDANGGNYVLLHTFRTTGLDGNYPTGLIQASDGTLYGTTTQGGAYFAGTLFKLQPDGSGYAVAHNFDLSVDPIDGRSPRGNLWQGVDGALYGGTTAGGTNNTGVLFRLAVNNGNFSSFTRLPDKSFQLTVAGAPLTYRIDASTNLENWVTLSVVSNTAAVYQFIDSSTTNYSRRFYRVHSSP